MLHFVDTDLHVYNVRSLGIVPPAVMRQLREHDKQEALSRDNKDFPR